MANPPDPADGRGDGDADGDGGASLEPAEDAVVAGDADPTAWEGQAVLVRAWTLLLTRRVLFVAWWTFVGAVNTHFRSQT